MAERRSRIDRDGDDKPQNQRAKAPSHAFSLLLEVALCFIMLCFIVLAGLALWMKDRPAGDTLGMRIEEVMRLGPTIYPVIFAALLSRSLKHIGQYSAQKGVRLGSLWTLMNTNSISDPISHLFSNTQSWLVLLLLPLCVLSPLGGQGSLRLMVRTNLTTTDIQTLRYLDTGPLGNVFNYLGIWVANDGAWPLSMRDAYLAGLMQTSRSKNGPVDQWQNVKIPRIDALSHADADPGGWIPTTNITGVQMYSSLVGLPIVGLLSTLGDRGDLRFSVEKTYIELACPSINSVQGGDTLAGLNVTCLDCDSRTEVGGVRCNSLLGPPVPQMTAGQSRNGNYTSLRQIQFVNTDSVSTTQTTCTATQRIVEAMVQCVQGDCSVTQVRLVMPDPLRRNFTSLDYWATSVLQMISQASQLPWGFQVMAGVSTSELFLTDPSVVPVQREQASYSANGVFPNLSAVNPQDFAARASILLNTGIDVFLAPTGFAGDLPTDNMTVYGPEHVLADGLLAFANASAWENRWDALNPTPAIMRFVNEDPPFMAASTNATVLRYTEVYQPSGVWVALLAISATLLLCLGVVGIALHCMTVTPWIFDPVIGLTYTNPYIDLPPEMEAAEAQDRLKVLARKKVILGYTGQDASRADIAFGEIGSVEKLGKTEQDSLLGDVRD